MVVGNVSGTSNEIYSWKVLVSHFIAFYLYYNNLCSLLAFPWEQINKIPWT